MLRTVTTVLTLAITATQMAASLCPGDAGATPHAAAVPVHAAQATQSGTATAHSHGGHAAAGDEVRREPGSARPDHVGHHGSDSAGTCATSLACGTMVAPARAADSTLHVGKRLPPSHAPAESFASTFATRDPPPPRPTP